jgi:hypothetical protein
MQIPRIVVIFEFVTQFFTLVSLIVVVFEFVTQFFTLVSQTVVVFEFVTQFIGTCKFLLYETCMLNHVIIYVHIFLVTFVAAVVYEPYVVDLAPLLYFGHIHIYTR